MKTRVCHITSVHNRYDIRIFWKQCISLAKNGYDVTLIVNDDKNDEIKENVKIKSTGFKPKNRLDRILHSSTCIFKKAIEIDADIYHIHDPELLTIGNKLKNKNKKVIFDSHEDVPSDIQDKDWIPKIFRKPIAYLYYVYEKNAAKKYDALICVTPHVRKRFLKNNKNTFMLTNYPIIDNDNKLVRKPSNAICYAGAIVNTWSHDKILKAMENIDGIKYLLAGKGTNQYLNFLRESPSWGKVEYKGQVSRAEVEDIYSQSIAGMAINYSKQLIEGEGTLGNNKIFEFMYAKLPVICSNFRLWREIVKENNCGICVDPNNIEDIEKAIKFILNNPEEAKSMGENGRRAVIEKYNWNSQESILLELYKQFTKVN